MKESNFTARAKDFLYLTRVFFGSRWWDIVKLGLTKFRHNLLQCRHPRRLEDYQLLSLLLWNGHQVEKATKHVSAGGGPGGRGYRHYCKMLSLLREIERRPKLAARSSDVIEWAKWIEKVYTRWTQEAGFVNVTAVSTAPGRRVIRPELRQSLNDLILNRTSTRLWLPEPVPHDVLDLLIRSGLSAPTSCSRQGVFFAVKRRTTFGDMQGVTNPRMLDNAPVVIYVCCDPLLYPENYAPALDAGMAAENILITAESCGLAGCAMYHCESFDQKSLRRELNLPAHQYVFLALLLGYPADVPRKPARIPISLRYSIIET